MLVWWVWVLGVFAVWVVVAALLALLIGRGIRMADRRSPGTGVALSTADLPASFVPAPAPVRRRAIPLPPIGISLAAVAVALETSGYLLRLNGATGRSAQLFSMDAPFALPRMFVALLFAAGAVAAVVAAGSIPGRRTWWLAVALVGGGIAAVKAGGTVHSDAMRAATDALGTRTAVLVSGLAALAVVSSLWFLSRTERRDRRRVLGTLAGYAAASVGLSAVSASVPSSWAVTATFIEESGEALAGVAFLIAVLVGVAPRLVLPAAWPLRRTADAHTLEVPAALPTRTVEGR
ncbi:MAG: hypothetical protein JWP62_3833 [Blastococcus sp.]|nr:hypothetical protein [Blastococcus sp.]